MTDQGFEFISFQVIENVPTHNDVEASILSVGQQVVENCLVSESILRGEIIKGAESMIKIFYIYQLQMKKRIRYTYIIMTK